MCETTDPDTQSCMRIGDRGDAHRRRKEGIKQTERKIGRADARLRRALVLYMTPKYHYKSPS